VHLDSLRAGTVAVLIQGSGDVRLSGSAPQQGYVIEGSGDVDASELVGRSVAVRIAGSGDANVWATESLSVDITGSGDVEYRGNASVKKSINGPHPHPHPRPLSRERERGDKAHLLQSSAQPVKRPPPTAHRPTPAARYAMGLTRGRNSGQPAFHHSHAHRR
jgi:hypothetical protein